MDALTRLIHMARPQAGLDLRCQLSGAYEIPHAAAPDGIVPFHLVLAGSCRIESSGGLLTARAGDFVLFPRGGTHRICDDGAHAPSTQGATRMRYDGMLPLRRMGKGVVDADLLCGHFEHARSAGELLFKSLPDPLHVSLQDDESPASLEPVVALMRHEAQKQGPGALAIVTALSQALLAMALRRFGERLGGQASILALLADAQLGASVRALLKEPGRAWTIEGLAKFAAMSRAHYARRFREASGMTVFDFMTLARMAIACDLLRETRRTVGDIGMEVGYQSEAAFGKAFRQRVGELPAQYRRRHGQPR
jgi:AraC family transcriptional activator of mtrCDE